jgi:thiosulfate/3-mercaptopyruvate sulfurtransferase
VGHIPGARFLAQEDLVVTRNGVPNELPDLTDLKRVMQNAGISDDSLIVLYADTSLLPATRAYFTLDYLGHGRQAALLDGGLAKWQSEERMVESQEYPIIRGHFSPFPAPELVARMDEVKRMAWGNSDEVLLDVRPVADYKAAHIPGALNVPAVNNQVSRDDQTLKPEAELLNMYELAGITPDRLVVTYCGTGMQASQTYFTLKYLGYDVRLYDGSMAEWTLRGVPVGD